VAVADVAIMRLWGTGSRTTIELGTDNFLGLPLQLHKGTEAAVARQIECEADSGRLEQERYEAERGRAVYFNLNNALDEAQVGKAVLKAALCAVDEGDIVRYDGFVMTAGTGGKALFTRGVVVCYTAEKAAELFQVLAATGKSPKLVQQKYELQAQRRAAKQAGRDDEEAGGSERGSFAALHGSYQSQASARSVRSSKSAI